MAVATVAVAGTGREVVVGVPGVAEAGIAVDASLVALGVVVDGVEEALLGCGVTVAEGRVAVVCSVGRRVGVLVWVAPTGTPT